MSALRRETARVSLATYQNGGPDVIPFRLLNLESLIEGILLALRRGRRRTVGGLLILIRGRLLLGRRVSLLVTTTLLIPTTVLLLRLLASPLRLAVLRLATLVAAVLTVWLRHSFVELIIIALRWCGVRLGHQVRAAMMM
jgi:hypothetical protein